MADVSGKHQRDIARPNSWLSVCRDKAANVPMIRRLVHLVQQRPRFAGSALVIIALTFTLRYFWSGDALNKKPSTYSQMTWKREPFLDVPKALQDETKTVKVEDKTLNFTDDNKKLSIFYKEVLPTQNKKSVKVLLLHGRSFSSQTWQEIGTLVFLGAMGYHTVAVDLPGYGKSRDQTVADKGKFLESFIKAKQMGTPVIVSPSMSGSFALPYIFSSPSSWEQRTSGYIPVAPVGSDMFTFETYKACRIPTMIVYGSQDTNLGHQSLRNLRVLPNSEVFSMADAGHAAYMDRPDEWHRLLYNFLHAVEHN